MNFLKIQIHYLITKQFRMTSVKQADTTQGSAKGDGKEDRVDSTFSTPVLTRLTPRVRSGSTGKLCASVAKIWLFRPHSACSFIHPWSPRPPPLAGTATLSPRGQLYTRESSCRPIKFHSYLRNKLGPRSHESRYFWNRPYFYMNRPLSRTKSVNPRPHLFDIAFQSDSRSILNESG